MNRNERILCEMDQRGYLFPEYELCMRDGFPVRLGLGTFSAVYEMVGKKWTGPVYACKVIGFDNENAPSERFREIVRLQKKLYEKSPNIVRILEAKELLVLADEAGGLIRVEDYKPGHRSDGIHLQVVLMEKLTDLIRQERSMQAVLLREGLDNEKNVLEFALQIGDALRIAHEEGIMHRDVKLENIFWDPSERRYKLGDFGIARYVEEGTASTVARTYGYSAPEIERGRQESYDMTVDIYSLGITLYLLLNDLKFPGSDYYRVNSGQYNPNFSFPAPAHASEAMTHVILKMCRYDSSRRYRSMDEVLEALHRVLSGARVKRNNGSAEKLPEEKAKREAEKERKTGDETETFRQTAERKEKKEEAGDETETFRRPVEKEGKREEKREETGDETETFRRPAEREGKKEETGDETETFRRPAEREEKKKETRNETGAFRRPAERIEKREKFWDETEAFFHPGDGAEKQAGSGENERRRAEADAESADSGRKRAEADAETADSGKKRAKADAENVDSGKKRIDTDAKGDAGGTEWTNTDARDKNGGTDWTNTNTETPDSGDRTAWATEPHETGVYLSRAERRREERIHLQEWRSANIKYAILLTAFLVPFLCGMQSYSEDWLRVEYVILPALFLMEAIMMSIHEFYLLVGAAAAIVFCYSARTTGLTVAHGVLLISALSMTPAVMTAGAVSTGLWMLLMVGDVGGLVSYLQNHDVSWVFLILTLLALYGVLSARIRTEQIERERGLRRISAWMSVLQVMALVAALLTLLGEFTAFTVPEVLERLHLVRTGILTCIGMYLLAQRSGYAQEMDQAIEEGSAQVEKDCDEMVEEYEKAREESTRLWEEYSNMAGEEEAEENYERFREKDEEVTGKFERFMEEKRKKKYF